MNDWCAGYSKPTIKPRTRDSNELLEGLTALPVPGGGKVYGRSMREARSKQKARRKAFYKEQERMRRTLKNLHTNRRS